MNPPPSLFYSSRTKEDGSLLGGRRCSDDWELLSLGMSTLMISPNNMKATVEAVARFFKLNLPTEERNVFCRKSGSHKKVTRSLVPSATTSKEMLEVGGEVADLVTYSELAEGTSLGLTFDGCTINMYGVFGGGVCLSHHEGWQAGAADGLLRDDDA